MNTRSYKLEIILFTISQFIVISGAMLKIFKVDYSIVPLAIGLILETVAIVSAVIKYFRK